jgi:hypothetical protein
LRTADGHYAFQSTQNVKRINQRTFQTSFISIGSMVSKKNIPLKDFRAIQKNEGIVKDHPMIIHVQMGSIKSLVFKKKNTCIYSFSQQGHKL